MMMSCHANGDSYELPDDLFDKNAGEVKPTKPIKKTAKATKPVRRNYGEMEVGPDTRDRVA